MLFLPREIENIINLIEKNGFCAYVVGGCVRDMLMGKPAHDYDIATSALPEDIISIFKKTVPTGIKHGTVTVLSEGYSVEVTTFRTEGDYLSHRQPKSVSFVKSIEEDLSRRDFTVNAMAYNKNGLVDPFGGRADLENKILRAVGDPEKRFNEDALRILRLFRFSSVLGFEIEEETLNAAVKLSHLLSSISAERIREELKKALNGEYPERLSPLTEKHITPDFKKIKMHSGTPLSLFAFLYSGEKDILKAAQILKLSNKEKESYQKLLFLLNEEKPTTKQQVKELLFLTSEEAFEDYILYSGEPLSDLFNEAKTEPYKISDLKIGGEDLMRIGISGAEIGETLEMLRKEIIICPDKNTKEILLKIASN